MYYSKNLISIAGLYVIIGCLSTLYCLFVDSSDEFKKIHHSFPIVAAKISMPFECMQRRFTRPFIPAARVKKAPPCFRRSYHNYN